jgi:hypothetical protein
VRTEDWLSVGPDAPAKACAIIKADVGCAGVPEDVAETMGPRRLARSGLRDRVGFEIKRRRSPRARLNGVGGTVTVESWRSTVFNVGTTGPGGRYDPAVTSWLVQFGQRTALMGISV